MLGEEEGKARGKGREGETYFCSWCLSLRTMMLSCRDFCVVNWCSEGAGVAGVAGYHQTVSVPKPIRIN